MPNRGQRYRDVVISGLAHIDAPHVITSADLEERLAPAMERLRIRRGLLARLAGEEERLLGRRRAALGAGGGGR